MSIPARMITRMGVRMVPQTIIFRRGITSSIILRKELPRPSEKYMSDIGEQPIPLTESDMAAKDVADIEIPQATIDEKTEIKKAMKKRSLRMTFWQLFLLTVLGSSVLNVMREKNLMDELDDNFEKKFNVIKRLIRDAESGKITMEEARETMKSWNERFVDVFELKPVHVDGVEGLNKNELRLAFQKLKGVDIGVDAEGSSEEELPKEQLNKFL